jgi:hypothetical protein
MAKSNAPMLSRTARRSATFERVFTKRLHDYTRPDVIAAMIEVRSRRRFPSAPGSRGNSR